MLTHGGSERWAPAATWDLELATDTRGLKQSVGQNRMLTHGGSERWAAAAIKQMGLILSYPCCQLLAELTQKLLDARLQVRTRMGSQGPLEFLFGRHVIALLIERQTQMVVEY